LRSLSSCIAIAIAEHQVWSSTDKYPPLGRKNRWHNRSSEGSGGGEKLFLSWRILALRDRTLFALDMAVDPIKMPNLSAGLEQHSREHHMPCSQDGQLETSCGYHARGPRGPRGEQYHYQWGIMVRAWSLPRLIKVSWPRIVREELVHTAHSSRVLHTLFLEPEDGCLSSSLYLIQNGFEP
jgi:hypothetical protein